MFGFEFAHKKKHHDFPQYDMSKAVKPEHISLISPLVWQEHCVECAMPDCYRTCEHYKRRSDGRCRLFKYGIERFENKESILNQNVVIDMDEWAKLETFFYTSGMTYPEVDKVNKRVVELGNAAQTLKAGKLRRFIYYIKEYYTRKIGDRNSDIPHFFLCEIINEEIPYVINLENRADNETVYRNSLKVKKGFNRFLIPTSEFNFVYGCRNNLLMYPEGNEQQLINFVSLELVSFKPEYMDLYLLKSDKKVKCVVWDLDNTVWDGTLGEDGIDGIKVKREIIEIIKNLDSKGIINSISSKNYEDKAIEALRKFGICDYFVYPMINWGIKSQNIRSIVKTLDIGMDTFVFVDDSFFELNEVKENCPGIRVCNVNDMMEFVKDKIFDVPVTEESKRRRESYKEIANRNRAAEEHPGNIIEFLRSCQMEARVNKPSESELMRCYELLQRTNQLNISGERLSIDEIIEIADSSDYECFRIKVKDRFGDYGLVGFAAFDISNQEKVVLRHFVFSCRAARKRIEQNFFAYMINQYEQKGFKNLELICKVTEKNSLMRQVLEESELFEKTEEFSKKYKLIHSMDKEVSVENIVRILEE